MELQRASIDVKEEKEGAFNPHGHTPSTLRRLEMARAQYVEAKPRLIGSLGASWRNKMSLEDLGRNKNGKTAQFSCQSARSNSKGILGKKKRIKRPQSCVNRTSLTMPASNTAQILLSQHDEKQMGLSGKGDYKLHHAIQEETPAASKMHTTPINGSVFANTIQDELKEENRAVGVVGMGMGMSGGVDAAVVLNSSTDVHAQQIPPEQSTGSAAVFRPRKHYVARRTREMKTEGGEGKLGDTKTSPPQLPSNSMVRDYRTTPMTPNRPNPHYYRDQALEDDDGFSALSEASSEHSMPRSDPEDLLKKQELTPNLTDRYTFVEYLGHGSYGHVYGALDLETGDKVAIKKITGVFDDVMHAKRLLRELRILRVLRHDHIIELRDILPPADINNFNELYIVFEFADTDLQKLINSNQHFSNLHIQFFLHQILVSLKYVHSANIIHRDLKPANILINANCSLMLCDFGLARGTNQNTGRNVSYPQFGSLGRSSASALSTASMSTKDKLSRKRKVAPDVKIPDGPHITVACQLTKHVVTRWYRAPELILLESNYTCSIDMWSVGCVLSELLSMQKESITNPQDRMALFPGRSCFPLSADHPLAYTDSKDQLSVIFDVIGTPKREDIQQVSSRKARKYLSSLPHKQSKDFKELYPGADPNVLELLRGLLQFNPRKRLTASQALNHPYLHSVRDATAELKSVTNPIFFEFEDAPITKSMIKDLIVKEVLFYNDDLKSQLIPDASGMPFYGQPSKRSKTSY